MHFLAYSPPSSAEVKNMWSFTSIPLHIFMVWCLIQHGIQLHSIVLSYAWDNFTIILSLLKINYIHTDSCTLHLIIWLCRSFVP